MKLDLSPCRVSLQSWMKGELISCRCAADTHLTLACCPLVVELLMEQL